jgi:hypothetical protein
MFGNFWIAPPITKRLKESSRKLKEKEWQDGDEPGGATCFMTITIHSHTFTVQW